MSWSKGKLIPKGVCIREGKAVIPPSVSSICPSLPGTKTGGMHWPWQPGLNFSQNYCVESLQRPSRSCGVSSSGMLSWTILKGLVLLIYQRKAVVELLHCILDPSSSSRTVTHSHVALGHKTEFGHCKSAAKRLIFVPFQKLMLTNRGKMVLFFRQIMFYPRRTKYFNITLLFEAHCLHCRYFSTSWKLEAVIIH